MGIENSTTGDLSGQKETRTPEEIKIEKKRNAQKNKLLRGGAEEVLNEKGEKILVVRKGQKVTARAEMNRYIRDKQDDLKESRRDQTLIFREEGAKYKIIKHKRHLLLNSDIELLRQEMDADLVKRAASKKENVGDSNSSQAEGDKNIPEQKPSEVAGGINSPESNKGNNPKDGKIEKTDAQKKAEAERYGFKEKPGLNLKTIFKTIVNTVGSYIGARVSWESIKLFNDERKKKGAKDATTDLLDALIEKNKKQFPKEKGIVGRAVEILSADGKPLGQKGFITEDMPQGDGNKYVKVDGKEVPFSRIKFLDEQNNEGKETPSVREKIAAFNERLKDIKLPENEKRALRSEMAKILWEHRHRSEELDKEKTEKVEKVYDVFASTSAQRFVVARETVNTLSVMCFVPWIRLAGYSALAAGESVAKAANNFDKMHFNDANAAGSKEKIADVAKAVTIGKLKETMFGFVGRGKNGEKLPLAAAIGASVLTMVSLGATALRLYGLADFEHALGAGNAAMVEGRQKLGEALKNGDIGRAMGQMGENWLINLKRVLGYVGFSGNHAEKMNNLVKGPDNNVGTLITKGQGIENGVHSELLKDPKSHGYTGDLKNSTELKEWANKLSHKLAKLNGFVKGNSETRLLDVAGGTHIRLDGDKIRLLNAETYQHVNENLKNLSHAAGKVKDEIFGSAKFYGEGQFVFDANNKVTDLNLAHIAYNPASYLSERNGMLTDKSLVNLMDNPALSDAQYIKGNELSSLLQRLFVYKETMKGLATKNVGGSPEIEYCQKIILSTLLKIEDKFGKVLKPVSELLK